MLLNYDIGEDSWESLGLRGDPTTPFLRRSVLGVHWKDWCCCWNSSTLATWWEELTHLKRPWGWERLKAGGDGDDRRWDDWMASPTQWTWFWELVMDRVSWPVAITGPLRVRHDWATELNWTELNLPWFMDLTFQVPMQYCFLQHWTLLPPPVTSTAGYCFCFGSVSSFFLELFLHWSPVA